MNSTRELHYRYLVSYLIFAIILLVALAYYDVPALVDKLSFALTLSSLVLAVLAIFYSVVAAEKQDIQLTKLVETNASLGGAAHEISSAASEMRAFAREAPSHFQSLRTKLDDMSVNFDTVRTEPAPQKAKEEEVDEIAAAPRIDTPQFYWMFGKLQFSAMAVLYLFVRSSRTNRSIEPDVFEKLDLGSFEYAVGVLNGLEASGIIAFKIHKGAIVPVTCIDVVWKEISTAASNVQSVVSPAASHRLRTLISNIDAHLA
jgi:hypothetical protein